MKKSFGGVDGEAVELYTLRHAADGGIEVDIITLGATVVSLRAPDVSSVLGEVTLGFDEATPYRDGTSPYFGTVPGRCANRIAKGRCIIDGKPLTLATNNAPNHLHGGDVGFDKRLWKAVAASPSSLTLELTSPDGEEGYPGCLTATVTYSLPTPTSLRIEYGATTDAPTVCNLSNHAYFNLRDGGVTPVLAHEIEIAADHYTPVDATSIPLGEVRAVSGAMDLRTRGAIGAMIGSADNGNGYDHNWCVSGPLGDDGLRAVARVYEPVSGRWMTARSDQPGAAPRQAQARAWAQVQRCQ